MITTPAQPSSAEPVIRREKNKTLTIRTPEGILFSLPIASPIIRFLALAIDKACTAIAAIVAITFIGLFGIVSPDIAGAVWILVSFLIFTGYPIAMEWFYRGQTVGKIVMHIRVIDEQGLKLRFSQVVIRNLLRVVDMLPGLYFVGGLSSFVSPHGQRIGDIVANTVVMRHVKIAEPDLDQINPGKFNSFREYPHISARLRQNTSPVEAGIALQALLRRNTLEDNARLELFAAIRAHIEAKVRFPPEAVEGISDEQYVRNVADILFR